MDKIKAVRNILKSKVYSELNTIARFLIIGIKSNETDLGRMDNNNLLLKNTAFRYDKQVTTQMIGDAKAELIEKGMIKIVGIGTQQEHIQDMTLENESDKVVNILADPTKELKHIRVIRVYKFARKRAEGKDIEQAKKEGETLTQTEIKQMSKAAIGLLDIYKGDIDRVKEKIVEQIAYLTKNHLSYNIYTIKKRCADEK